MSTTQIGDVVDLLTAKAKKAGLSLAQFELLCEFAEDVSSHAGVEPLGYQKTEFGCGLTLFSERARYVVKIVRQTPLRVIEVVGAAVIDSEAKADRRHGLLSTVDNTDQESRYILKAYREGFDTCQTVLICESEDSISGWEQMRGAILESEDFEWQYVRAKKPKAEIEEVSA